jgi:hypothetical protein
MKRDLALAVVTLWGAALLCVSALDWADYQRFLWSLLLR